ncbi:MAG: VWA domain-containing protein [Polyangiaceae bacterium]|nr:VWA domain-containing protein [Polyangiaceae bacterium]
MRRTRLGWACLLSALWVGCGGAATPEPEVARTAPQPTVAVATTTSNGTAAPKPAEIHDQLKVEVTPGVSLLAADQAQEMFVRVRVKGLPLVTEKRTHLDLALAVDTSGSMEGPGIERVREACATLVDKMEDGDTLSIVTFGSQPKLVLEPTTIDKTTREKAKKAIHSMVADGTTDMGGALATALGLIQARLHTDAIHRIVLVGDGVPNDTARVNAVADQAAASKIPITTLGVGAEFDETLMSAIAQRSGGTFHFADDASRVAKVFEEELTKMQRVVARGTRVDIIPGPGVVIHEVVGMPNAVNGRNASFLVGDLAEGQSRDALLRVTVGQHRDGVKVEILDAVASYQHGVVQTNLTAREFESIATSADKSKLADARVPDVEHQGIRLQVADSIVKAIALARAGDLKGARALLDKTAKLAKQAGEKFNDNDLAERAKEALSLRKKVASLAPPPDMGVGMGTGMGMGAPGGMSRMKAMPSPAKMSHADAMQVKGTHSAAMMELQQ